MSVKDRIEQAFAQHPEEAAGISVQCLYRAGLIGQTEFLSIQNRIRNGGVDSSENSNYHRG